MAQTEYEEEWQPRTRVGLMVKEGLITSIEEIFQQSLRIMEPQIVDILLVFRLGHYFLPPKLSSIAFFTVSKCLGMFSGFTPRFNCSENCLL